MKPIILEFSDKTGNVLGCINAELNNTKIAKSLYKILPITHQVCYWGNSLWGQVCLSGYQDEIFSDACKVGDIAYWPDGKQIHIYYGKTPASKENQPEPPSLIINLGLLKERMDKFKKLLNSLPKRFSYITFIVNNN